MKTTKILLLLAFLVACACLMVNYLAKQDEPNTVSQNEPLPLPSERRVKHVVAPRTLPGENSVARPLVSPGITTGAAELPPELPPSSSSNQKEWQDPEARLALAMVGADAVAEAYWFGAINDPNLPAKERQDLIEDLNEEGFADPKNITSDDLPLILNRIELIEELAPDAMDSVNAAAFQEAYKDLLNMYNKAMADNPVVR